MSTRSVYRFAFLSVVVAVLAACSGGSSGQLAPAQPAATSVPPATTAIGPAQRLYVPDETTNAVTVYPVDANGNVAPVQAIAGPNTLLDTPVAVAVDSNGEIYASSEGGTRVFSANANGDATPIRTVGNAAYTGLAIDAHDNVYGPPRAEQIDVFAPGATVAERTIIGPNTGLARPFGVAVTANGKVYVANQPGPCGASGSITAYAAGAAGNVSPVQSIGGANTRIDEPASIALDSAGNIYLGNSSGVLTIFAPAAHGNVAPIATILVRSGAFLSGVAIDAAGEIFVADDIANQIDVYPPLTQLRPDGMTAPIRVISGDKTGLSNPLNIAVR